MTKHKIDWPSFSASIALILAACVPLVLFPETGATFLRQLYDKVTEHFGFLYLLAGLAVLVFLGWLALSRYGRVRLAADDEPPEFNTLSWTAMLFCAGVGAGTSLGCSGRRSNGVITIIPHPSARSLVRPKPLSGRQPTGSFTGGRRPGRSIAYRLSP
jgi:hypothetical protein